MEIMIFFVWFVFALFVAGIGSGREIGGWAAFFISIFLSPVIGLIIVLFSKDKDVIVAEKKAREKKHNEQINELKKISKQNAPVSMADELYKLKELFSSGALTDIEYKEAKAKVLRSGPLT